MSMQSGDHSSYEFDVNLAPIIDCLVVLISFMLASATFLSIGLLDAGVSAVGSGASEGPPPPVRIVVDLQKNFTMSLKVSGEMEIKNSIESLAGVWNFVQLKETLDGLKQKYPQVSVLTLSADDSIEYQEVIRALEAIGKSKYEVLLGEF